MAQEYKFKQKYPVIQDMLDHNISGNKNYAQQDFSGLGRVYLDKNVKAIGNVTNNWLEQSMMTQANTVYVIQYDYDLNGQTINLPTNCLLEFAGGSLSNGYLSGSLLNEEINMEYINVEDLSTFINTLTLREGQHVKLKAGAVYDIHHRINIAVNDVVFDGNGATINAYASGGFRLGHESETIYSGELVTMEDPSVIDSAEIAAVVKPGDMLVARELTPIISNLNYTYGVESEVTDVTGTKVGLSIPVYRKQYERVAYIPDVHGIELCNMRIINCYMNGQGYATQSGITIRSNHSKVHHVFYDGADGASLGISSVGMYNEIYNCEVCNVWHIKDGQIDNSAGYAIYLSGNYDKAYSNTLYDNKSNIDGGNGQCTVYGIEVFDNVCNETFYRTKAAKESDPLPVTPPKLNKDHSMINFHGGVEGLCLHDNIITVKYRSHAIGIRCNGIAENNIIYYNYHGSAGSENHLIRNYELSSDFIWRNNRIVWDDTIDFSAASYVMSVSRYSYVGQEYLPGQIVVEGNENWPSMNCNGINHIDTLIVRNNNFVGSYRSKRFLYISAEEVEKIDIENNHVEGTVFFSSAISKVKEFYFRLNTANIPADATDSSVMRLKGTVQGIWDRIIVEKNRFFNQGESEIPLFSNINALNAVSVVDDNELVNVFYDGGSSPEEPHFSAGTYDNVPETTVVGYRYYVTDLKKNIYWDGTEWVKGDGTPIQRYTFIPEMTKNTRLVKDGSGEAVVGEAYNWRKTTSNNRFDCCALSVPAGVKVTVLGSGQGTYAYAWLMLDENNVVLAKSRGAMGGYGKDQILYEGVTPSACKLIINVSNENATVNVMEDDELVTIPYPYWNKDSLPYVVELSSWSEFTPEYIPLT